MTTTATIETPTGEWYGVDSDGQPDHMIPYLEDIVEDAVAAAEEKYKNPEEYWEEELRRKLDARSTGYYSELEDLSFYSRGEHHYRITSDQQVEEVTE